MDDCRLAVSTICCKPIFKEIIMEKDSDKRSPQKSRLNCWEVMMCGREVGGKSSAEYGVCPAAADESFDGINSGKCGGRICWAVAGTFCGGCVQGSFADKRCSCLNCDFYQMVQEEEGLANRQTKFLQFLSQENRSPFFDKMTYRHIKAGERFVIQDAVEDTAYIIQRGSCLVIVEKDGELHPVDHYGEGDIIGGLGILTGEPRRAHVEAETDMDLWVMTKDQFDEMTEKDPALLDFVTELVADRLNSRRPTAYRTIGKYVATDIIGRGAFSIVYKGIHKRLGMPVVIKMMRHDMALYPEFLDSFHNEAKTIASLAHDHILKVYDFEERYRTLFIIMEYLRGDSLKDMISRLRALPPQLTAKYLVQIGSALAYAHKCGIIHRDINPSNIMVQPNDNVKILDFGLACPSGTEDFSSLGTAYYMAPEQIEGLPLDPRTDIYALGITAFEMVTGKRPFPEENTEVMLNLHLTQDITDPGQIITDIPDELRAFILKAARCDPDQRYQDMDQAMAALRPIVQDDGQPKRDSTIDNKKSASIFLTYADENQSALQQLVDVFKSDAKALGVNVNITHNQDH
jgi:tRNA A-37 threonylcarbamoyl transferase component Bud32